jgi:hypothetical protein
VGGGEAEPAVEVAPGLQFVGLVAVETVFVMDEGRKAHSLGE